MMGIGLYARRRGSAGALAGVGLRGGPGRPRLGDDAGELSVLTAFVDWALVLFLPLVAVGRLGAALIDVHGALRPRHRRRP